MIKGNGCNSNLSLSEYCCRYNINFLSRLYATGHSQYIFVRHLFTQKQIFTLLVNVSDKFPCSPTMRTEDIYAGVLSDIYHLLCHRSHMLATF